MREILFRGKRLDNGEWETGSLMKVTVAERTYFLIFGDGFAYDAESMKALAHGCVDPDTVGQYTGLTDKNGKRIFEGDILDVNGYAYACRWDEGNVEFGIYNQYESIGIVYIGAFNSEVIGNIHDNPELLEGGVNDG